MDREDLKPVRSDAVNPKRGEAMGFDRGALLAVETTGSACSVALVSDGRALELTRIAPRQHNALILTMVDQVMAAGRLNAGELAGVAFSAGPGSFTGVRIGAAIAQGIALGGGIPVIPVPTSEVAAEQARRRNDAARGVVVARGSRAGWVYAARYRFSRSGVECEEFDTLVPDDALPAVSAGWVVSNREQYLRAAVVGELAGGRPGVDPERAVPFYVDGDSPWRKVNPARRTSPAGS